MGAGASRRSAVASRYVLFAAVLSCLGCCSGPNGDSDSSELTDFEASYIGVGDAGLEARIQREIFESEQLHISKCMQASGFEYVPTAPDATVTIFDGPSRVSREFAEKYGFLISTQPALDPLSDPSIQANLEIRDSLSPAALASYNETLLECETSAQPEYGGEPVAVLSERVVDKIAEVKASRAWNEINADWVDCVAELGIEAQSHDDLVLSLWDDFSRIEVNDDGGLAAAEVQEFTRRELQLASLTWKCNSEYFDRYQQLLAKT